MTVASSFGSGEEGRGSLGCVLVLVLMLLLGSCLCSCAVATAKASAHRPVGGILIFGVVRKATTSAGQEYQPSADHAGHGAPNPSLALGV